MSTQIQSVVSGALDELKLESQPPKDGIVGGPSVFLVTKKTLEFLEGKKVIVHASGSVDVTDA